MKFIESAVNHVNAANITELCDLSPRNIPNSNSQGVFYLNVYIYNLNICDSSIKIADKSTVQAY